MEMRDRLIELINDCRSMDGYGMDLVEKQADYLLANGVIVPPCKVGETVYKIMDIESVHRRILEVEVLSIRIEDKMKFFVKTVKNYLYRYAEYPIDDFGKTVFLTKEEAEKALKEREGNG